MESIIPAIIPTSLADLQNQVSSVDFATQIQIDIVDGVFAAPASWPYAEEGDITEAAAILNGHQVMVDLMVSDPLPAAEAWLAAGAKIIVVHLVTVSDWTPLLNLHKQFDFKLYVAATVHTTIDSLVSVAQYVDGIQFMGIETIGRQGQAFSPLVLTQITELKQKLPTIPLVIDGGMKETTIPLARNAGADYFVVGSAILAASDKEGMYKQLRSLVRQ